jgi:hypothetical protein
MGKSYTEIVSKFYKYEFSFVLTSLYRQRHVGVSFFVDLHVKIEDNV